MPGLWAFPPRDTDRGRAKKNGPEGPPFIAWQIAYQPIAAPAPTALSLPAKAPPTVTTIVSDTARW